MSTFTSGGQGPAYLEEDYGGYNGQEGEHDIVNWGHDGGVEEIQRFIQVVHLSDDAKGHYLQQRRDLLFSPACEYRLCK